MTKKGVAALDPLTNHHKYSLLPCWQSIHVKNNICGKTSHSIMVKGAATELHRYIIWGSLCDLHDRPICSITSSYKPPQTSLASCWWSMPCKQQYCSLSFLLLSHMTHFPSQLSHILRIHIPKCSEPQVPRYSFSEELHISGATWISWHSTFINRHFNQLRNLPPPPPLLLPLHFFQCNTGPKAVIFRRATSGEI